MSTRSRFAVLALLALLLALVEAPATSHEEPSVLYWQGDETVVSDRQGNELGRFPNFNHASLGGHLVAGDIQPSLQKSWINAYDAVTGQQYFRIKNARNPVVIGETGKVAFWPGYHRDVWFLSVWMRLPTGAERKIVQFKHPGQPGIPRRMGGEGTPLDMAFDRRGRTVAVSIGNENLRLFDTFVVDVKTRELIRRTNNGRTWEPSVSPNGTQLAVRSELRPICDEGYRAGRIEILSLTSTDKDLLTTANCELFYDTPRWIDNETLMVTRIERLGPGSFNLDLLAIDVETRAVEELLTDGNPCCISVSATQRIVAYPFTDVDGFSMLDIETMDVTDFPQDAGPPQLSGENRL
jgi:hypothetical protein